jgi:hypothetical protein
MVLAVVEGFDSADQSDGWGLADDLRKNGYDAAAKVAAKRWGSSPWLRGAAHDCDIAAVRFWVGAARSSAAELRSAMASARLTSSKIAASDKIRSRGCQTVISILESQLAKQDPDTPST